MTKRWHDRKKTSIRKSFGENVKKRRLQLGLTQEELSELAGVHPTYLGSVERGERNVCLENINALAKALGCKPSDIV